MGDFRDSVDLIRSKNVNPFEIAVDIIIKDTGVYERAKASDTFSRESIADYYGIDEGDVKEVFFYDRMNAVKVIIQRPVGSGTVGDTDVYGAQQYAPLLDVTLPDEPTD